MSDSLKNKHTDNPIEPQLLVKAPKGEMYQSMAIFKDMLLLQTDKALYGLELEECKLE